MGGISLVFSCAESPGTFTEGQIVTYRDAGNGKFGQAAQDVRAQS